MARCSPQMGEARPRRDGKKADKSALVRSVLTMLQEKPQGMAGGLLTQRLKQSDLHRLTVVYGYGASGDLQRGWLQDLTRRLPEVEQTPMGRDTWYACRAEFLNDDVDTLVSPQRCSSGSSFGGGSPGFSERSPGFSENSPPTPPTPPPLAKVVMETDAQTDLANAVRSLLQDAPGGMSASALGLRLRRLDPGAIEAFQGEASPGEKKPAIQDFVRSVPGVVVQSKGGSEFYSIDKTEALQSVSEDPFAGILDPSFSMAEEEEQPEDELPEDSFRKPKSSLLPPTFFQQVQAFINGMCNRRASRI